MLKSHAFLTVLLLLSLKSARSVDPVVCIIPTVANAGILQKDVGDELTEGEVFTVACYSEFQLDDISQVGVECIEGQMPLSCRKLTVTSASDTVYAIGDEIKITCQVNTAEKVTAISWTKDGSAFRVDQGSFLDDQTSPYTSVLTFTAQSGDSGGFGCIATMETTSIYTTETYNGQLQITVLALIMTPDTDVVYPLIGETIPLTCQFTMVLTYGLETKWMMGSGTVSKQLETTVGTVRTSELTLTAKKSYSNTYSCEGTYEHFGSNKEIILTNSKQVEVRGITTHPTTVNLQMGGEATFTCISVGEAEASVEWLVAGAVQDTALQSVVYSEGTRATTTILSLSDVQQQESVVKCELTYGGDTILTSDEASLVALSIGFIQMPVDSGFVKGSDDELTCIMRSQTELELRIEWLKGSEDMPDSSYSTSRNSDSTVHTSLLYIEDAGTADNGEYTCRATYTIGVDDTIMDSDVASIFVREVRFRPTGNWVLSNDVADTKIFTCYYFGDYEAGIGVEGVTWWVNDVNVDGVEGFAIEEGSHTGVFWQSTITMTNINVDMSGKVMCTFSCGLGGSISGEGYLYVHRQVELPATTLTDTSTTSIMCSVLTNERATVAWFKDSTFIGINDNNFAAQTAAIEGYAQYNSLAITGWSYSKSRVTIKCKYTYPTTSDTYETSTVFIFKGIMQAPNPYSYWNPTVTTLHCNFGYSVSESAPTDTTWLKDGVTVDGNSRYTTSNEVQTGLVNSKLEMLSAGGDDMIISDSGLYTCKFLYIAPEEYISDSSINFYTLATSPAESQFYDSDTLALTCTLTSKDVVISSVIWMFDGAEVPSFTGTSSLDGAVTVLTINKVLEVNSGIYTCKLAVPGSQEIQGTKLIAILNIDMLSDADIKIVGGADVTLSCSVEYFIEKGVPDIKWYKNTVEVTSGVTQSVNVRLVTSLLNFPSLQTSDTGEYRCGIGASRSIDSTTLVSATITATDTVTMAGVAATITCALTDSGSDPTSIYWADNDGTEYRADTVSGYTVTNGAYSTGSQTTSLTVDSPQDETVYTCNFVIDGVTNQRVATVYVPSVATTPSQTYIGSSSSIQCRIEGSNTSPSGVVWRKDQDTISNTEQYTITTGQYQEELGILTSTLTLASATVDTSYTCVYTVGTLEMSGVVTSEVYMLSIPAEVIILRDNQLDIIATVEPAQANPASLVSDLAVTANTSINGLGTVSGLTVTYDNVVGPMLVTLNFQDTSGNAHSEQSTVHVADFESPIVSVSDGTGSVIFTCVITGIPSGREDISMFWEIGDKDSYSEPTTTGATITSQYTYDVTSSTVDTEVTCGVDIAGTEYTHHATLDIVDIQCPSQVTLPENGKVAIICQITGSENIEPLKAVWYKDNVETKIEPLTDVGWPDTLTPTLDDITLPGTYRVVVDFGIAQFSRTITVAEDGSVTPTDPPTSAPPDSGSSVGLIVGIAIAVLLVIVLVVVVAWVCLKKVRGRTPSARSPDHVKTISANTSSYARPDSLIYHNELTPVTDPHSNIAADNDYEYATNI